MVRLLAASMPMSKSDSSKVIGIESDTGFIMPWNVPSDLQNFKKETQGTTLVMGHNTWLSIGRRMLPGRKHIVITRNTSQRRRDNTHVTQDLEFLELGSCYTRMFQNPDIHYSIIGGAEIYKSFLADSLVDEVIMTHLDSTLEDTDWYKGQQELGTLDQTRIVKFPWCLMTDFVQYSGMIVPPSDRDDCGFTATKYTVSK